MDDGKDVAHDGRDESANERSDRNWGEILQELRVTQTGTQIIGGFLLAIAFQERFSDLDSFQLTVYVTLVLLAAVTTALGLAPVGLHRGLFHQRQKVRMVSIGDALLVADLVLVSLLTGGIAFFIVDVVVGRPTAIAAGCGIYGLLLVLLVALPRYGRRR